MRAALARARFCSACRIITLLERSTHFQHKYVRWECIEMQYAEALLKLRYVSAERTQEGWMRPAFFLGGEVLIGHH